LKMNVTFNNMVLGAVCGYHRRIPTQSYCTPQPEKALPYSELFARQTGDSTGNALKSFVEKPFLNFSLMATQSIPPVATSKCPTHQE